MKNRKRKTVNVCQALIITAIMLVFAGCSTHYGNIGGGGTALNSNNFKVVESVTGQASVNYIFGIGADKQNLVDQARRDMVSKANLAGSSKAIINITMDTKSSWFLVWCQKTVYVSGEVVEFK